MSIVELTSEEAEPRPPRDPRDLEITLAEYSSLQQEKRLIEQLSFAAVGFGVAGSIALFAAAAQANSPDILMMWPTVLLVGGVFVAVLHVYLLRLSVYLGLTERELSRRVGADRNLMGWESSLTFDLDVKGRGWAGLSPNVSFVMGFAVGCLALALGAAIFAQSDLFRSVAIRTADERLLLAAYVVPNGLLLIYASVVWANRWKTLREARDKFLEDKHELRDRPEDAAAPVGARPSVEASVDTVPGISTSTQDPRAS